MLKRFFFLITLLSVFILNAEQNWITVYNVKTYPVMMLVQNNFGLCDKTATLPTGQTIKNICFSTMIPGRGSIRYTAPAGSALDSTTINITVMIWDGRVGDNGVILWRDFKWHSLLEYPRDFPSILP